jgi:uncharacterized protein YjiS (DUF1127 family)
MEFAMTDIVIHRSNAEPARPAIAAMLGCSLQRAMIAQEARIALNDLPDILLDDIGIPRNEIPYVAGVIAAAKCDPGKTPGGVGGDAASEAAARGLSHGVVRAALMTLITVSMLVLASSAVLV